MGHNFSTEELQDFLGFNNPKAGGMEKWDLASLQGEIKTSDFTRYTEAAKKTPMFNDSLGADGAFVGTSGRQDLINQIRMQMETHGGVEEIMKDTLADLGEGNRVSKGLERSVTHSQADMEKVAGRFHKVAKSVQEAHHKANLRLREDSATLLGDLTKEYGAARKQIAETAIGSKVTINGTELKVSDDTVKNELLGTLESNFYTAQDHIKTLAEETAKAHQETLTELRTLTADVEKTTGVKAPASLTASLEKEGSQVARATEGAAESAAHGGMSMGRVALGAAGAAVGIDGFRRLFGGSEESTSTDKVIGAAETGGGLLMLYKALKNGASKAASMHMG